MKPVFQLNILLITTAITCTVLMNSCNNEPRVTRSTSNFTMMDDTVIRYNRGVLKGEDREIRDFLDRYGWKVDETPTGLRYFIYYHGSGPMAEKNRIAVVKYSLKLLNGNSVYNSDSAGPKEFLIGHGLDEPGLQEGVSMMHVGDKMKLIVPSHLGYGLLGDNNKIPPNSVLVYDVELTDLKTPPKK
jgi:FKBP-type peptidyl-prolyl cis-trans isomerase FkpA